MICIVLWKIICLMLISVVFVGKTQYVKKAPQFFCAYTCTLGSQNAASNGLFACPTPYVIPRTDKYSLSVVGATKSGGFDTSFEASVIPATGINTSRFDINLTISSDNLQSSFCIVAIGFQTLNTWVDLFDHILPYDAFNTLANQLVTIRNQSADYIVSSKTMFSDTSNLNLVPLISSYYLYVGDTTLPNSVEFTASILNSSSIQANIKVLSTVHLHILRGFILVYNTLNIASNAAFYAYDTGMFKKNVDYTFQTTLSIWGPRFDTKCVIGFYKISYFTDYDYRVFFVQSPKLNYIGFQNLGATGTAAQFYASVFCISKGDLECGQSYPYYDAYLTGCFTASTCPIPSTAPQVLPAVPIKCPLCSPIDCTDCASTNRNYCLSCNSTKLAVAVNGVCECIVGYYRPSATTSCALNCTYHISGCKAANCTNQTDCNECLVGYHLDLVTTQYKCKQCGLSIANCTQCNDQYQCTLCQPLYYLNFMGVGQVNCLKCNVTIPNCQFCYIHASNGLTCSSCYTGFTNTFSACTCSVSSLTGCLTCTIPTQCTSCHPAYFLNPSTKLCQLCTTLFQCNSCAAFNDCTSCKDYHIRYFNSTDNSNLCVACNYFLSNCHNCSSTSVCTLCDSGYGLTAFNQCQSCSSLHPHCALCTDHTICTQCDLNSYTFFINNTCITCSDAVSQCSTCTPSGNQLICVQCSPGHFLDPVGQVCYLCSDYIDDCSQCQYNQTTLKPQCTECTSLFLVDDKFTCQKCKQGNYVTRSCSNVTGCSSSHVINGITTCLSCDASLFFQYDKSTKKCVCQQGFELQKSSQLCEQICGDGLSVNMACDDGNKINGDGCSDQCTVEDKFQCTTSLTDPTSCVLNEDISVVYDYTLRHMGENKLSMYFTVSPAYTALNKVDWKKTITFNFSEPIVCEFSYNDGILIITMEYTADLDDKLMDLMIEFDPSVINSESQSLSFTMGAVNGPLTYESESNMAHYKVFNTTGLVIGVICLTFYLVSSYFHKMIGLETIQFIQIIYFVRLISGSGVTSSFYAFNTLKYANGYNDILSTSSNSVEDFKSIPVSFIKLNLKLYFLENCNLMLIPIALATLAYFYYAVKKSRSRTLYSQTKDKIHKDLMVIQNRKLEWIYDSLIFSFTLSLLYLIVFSMLLTDLSVSQPKSLYSSLFILLSYAVSLIVLFVVSAIYCHEVISGIKKYQEMTDSQNVRSEEKSLEHDANGADHGFHPLYVSFYLVYQLVLIVVLSLVVFTKFSGVIETVLGFSGVHLLVIVLWKPYKVKIHNNAIIGHQVIIFLFVLFQLLSKYKLIPASIMSVFLYIILAFIFIALVLQLIRLYIHKKQSQKDLDQNNIQISLSNTKGLNKVQKDKLILNPFSYYQKQISSFERQNFKPNHSFFSNQKFTDHIPACDLMDIKKNAIKQKQKSQKLKKHTMNQILQDHQHYDLQVKKYRLRQQLNVFYGDQAVEVYKKL